MSELSIDERIELITRNLVNDKEHSLLTEDALKIMRSKLESGSFKIYWGTATTGRPHIAYFVPISKIADFLRAGVEVTILFADLHAYLDNQKAPYELLNQRVNYYEFVIKQMLLAIKVPIENLKFVRGTTYQLSQEYTLDLYKFSSMVTEHDAKKAGAEVVKQVASPLLSGLLYPCLQVLDEKYLGVDAQFGGVDQRKIFTLAEKYLAKLGYKKCIHLMNPMVPGLAGAKMSSSDANSKIDLLDTAAQVKKKVNSAYCKPGELEGNGVLSFAKMVLFPIFGSLKITRKPEHGGDVVYDNYQSLEDDFVKELLWPNDLKAGVIAHLTELMKPIRDAFDASAEVQRCVAEAYADEHPVATSNAPQPAVVGGKATVANLDLRVGRVTKVSPHPHGDKLYVEEIDIGEAKPRTIVSGLKDFVSEADLLNSLVVVVANLKPSKLRNVLSEGMVLAASNDDHTVVELITPPADSKPGDKVFANGFEGQPDASIDASKRKNTWKSIKEANELRTTAELVAAYDGVPLQTSSGVVTVKSLANATIG